MTGTPTNVSEYGVIAKVVQHYIDGAKSGRGDDMKPAFHKDATIFGYVGADLLAGPTAQAESPADLNDLEIAHVAYTADLIDIRYAHLALAISTNPSVHEFAQTMIRDHSAVNDQALALVTRLNVALQDNFLSQKLNRQAEQLVREMSKLSGADFDRRYTQNELGYHQAVNGLVEGTFIPNIQNPDVKALFETAIVIFKAHEKHAEKMVASLENEGS